jgi:hypothetical protein
MLPQPLPAGGYVYTADAASAINTLSASNRVRPQTPDAVPRINMEDMNSDVFNAKVETLIDLWVTRYGNAWVDLDQVMEDVFYGRVYKRLKTMSELEVHFLTDRARFVCRRPE